MRQIRENTPYYYWRRKHVTGAKQENARNVGLITPDWLRKRPVQFALSVWNTGDHVAGNIIDMRYKTSAVHMKENDLLENVASLTCSVKFSKKLTL